MNLILNPATGTRVVPTTTENDGRNLFFVFTTIIITGWVVEESLNSVFSSIHTPPLYGMHFVEFKGSVRSVV